MKEPKGITELPSPPLPKWALNRDDCQYEPPTPKKREEVNAQLTTGASVALDVLEWHARNMADAKSSIQAACALLDRAGYAAAKGGTAQASGFGSGGGAALPTAESTSQRLSDRFLEAQAGASDEEEDDEGRDAA